MKHPYIITAATLVTYDGHRIPLEIIESEIIDRPRRLVEEQILDSFQGMSDPAVRVELKVKYI